MTHPFSRNRFFLAASILLISGALAACGDDTDTTTTAATGTTTATGTGGAGGGAGGEGGGSGGEGGGSGGQGGSTGELSDVEVTVNYMGMVMVTDKDALNVAAFEVGKPMGIPPAFFTQKNPMFPVKGTLNDLEPGSYNIIAVLDVGGNNPSMPGPEDLVGATSMPVEVTGSAGQTAVITIMDK
jgi:hypothetical protein